jgi:hypothetical protein|tara:strand:+ start:8847 stop:9815 length:969 start_codon:yes stop_codon:yes gene_type:complete
MASGSSVTASGMQTMTQTVAGDVIDDADFNNARENVSRLMGTAQDVTLGTYTAASTYGWGQGGAGVTTVAAGELVYASTASKGFKDLQDDVQAMCAFLGVSLRTGVGSDVTTSVTITASTWANLMLNIQDCWNARFSPAGRTISTDGSATRTASWTGTLNQETTWTFASEAVARGFFNGGGTLGVSGSYTGSSGDQFTAHAARLSGMGDFYIDSSGASASAGTSQGKGFYELTTSFAELWSYYGASSPYSNDYIKVFGKINSTTNPTVVTLKTTLVDATDNVIDAPATGTLTINARRRQPNASGSGFSFAVPTDSVGAVSGS